MELTVSIMYKEPKEDEEVQKSRPLNESEERWIEYMEKLHFESFERFDDAFGRLSTYTIGTIAGFATLIRVLKIPLHCFVYLPIIMLLIVLLFILFTNTPKNLYIPSSKFELAKFKQQHEKRLDRRSNTLFLCNVGYASSLFIIVGVILFSDFLARYCFMIF